LMIALRLASLCFRSLSITLATSSSIVMVVRMHQMYTI